MFDKSTDKHSVEIEFYAIKHADTIENILCLATLIANKKLPYDSTIAAAENFYNSLDHGCNQCPYTDTCLACIINA